MLYRDMMDIVKRIAAVFITDGAKLEAAIDKEIDLEVTKVEKIEFLRNSLASCFPIDHFYFWYSVNLECDLKT